MPFQRSTFEPHPEGTTIGTFVDFKDEPDGKYGPQIRCSFDTEEEMDDGRPFRVSYWITDQFNPRSNSYKFLKAMGLDVDNITDEELAGLDLDDLLNRKCQLVIEHVKRQDGSLAGKVTNLLRLKRGSRQAPVAEPAEDEERELVGAGAGRSGKKTAFPGGDDD